MRKLSLAGRNNQSTYYQYWKVSKKSIKNLEMREAKACSEIKYKSAIMGHVRGIKSYLKFPQRGKMM